MSTDGGRPAALAKTAMKRVKKKATPIQTQHRYSQSPPQPDSGVGHEMGAEAPRESPAVTEPSMYPADVPAETGGDDADAAALDAESGGSACRNGSHPCSTVHTPAERVEERRTPVQPVSTPRKGMRGGDAVCMAHCGQAWVPRPRSRFRSSRRHRGVGLTAATRCRVRSPAH